MGMNVVCSGNTYQIYGSDLKTYKNLPSGTYEVMFSKLTGFYLSSHTDLVVTEEKIYGSTPYKVEKVLNSFSKTDRNLGVILSGKKGIGKSLFARLLSIRARDYKLPLIIVPSYFPGIANFISSIQQEVIVLFDEFEKTFPISSECNTQDEMLPLFDGVDSGKKLFIITCNEVHKLSQYMINRPGRFHYHFVIGKPSCREIKEYMTDKLHKEYHGVIDKIISLSMHVDLTYDVLRAIVFEINNGYSLSETMTDLNISKEETPEYNVVIEFEDGSVCSANRKSINVYSDEETSVWVKIERGNIAKGVFAKCISGLSVEFKGSDVITDVQTSRMTIEPSKVGRFVDSDYFNMNDETELNAYNYIMNLPISKVSLSKVSDISCYKFLI